MYSEEFLRSSKYNDLLKIAKEFGIKRQKTDKLIGSILKAQDDANSSKLNVSLKSLKEDNGENISEDELLDDIVEPDLSFDLNVSKNKRKSRSLSKSPELRRVSRGARASSRTSLSELEKDSIFSQIHSIRRSQTFSINKDANSSKRKLSPKSESLSNEHVLSSPSKKRKTSQGESAVKSNSRRKSLSASDENLSCNEVQSSKDIEELVSDDDKDTAPYNALNISLHSGRKSLRGRLLISRLSSAKRRSNTIVPTVAAEAPIINNRRRSHTSPSVSKSLSVSADVEQKKDLSVSKSVKSTKVETTHDNHSILTNSLKRKPTFTIGQSPTVQEKEKNSGIPRFVAYARKMKMPDFEKIHRKAFKKMEALDDYVERKNSGSAVKKSVVKNQPSFKPTVTKVDEVKINFTDKGKMNFGQNIPKVTPRTSSQFRRTSVTASGGRKSIVKRNSSAFCVPQKEIERVKPKLKSPVQKMKKMSSFAKRHLMLQNEENRSKVVRKGKVGDKPSALPRLVKENIPFRVSASRLKSDSADGSLTPGSFNRRKQYKPELLNNKPVNYKPYVGAIPQQRSINRAVLKEMVEKNPRVKQSVERRNSQKMYIKGVRTNKRFALQMAKRGL